MRSRGRTLNPGPSPAKHEKVDLLERVLGRRTCVRTRRALVGRFVLGLTEGRQDEEDIAFGCCLAVDGGDAVAPTGAAAELRHGYFKA
jgi:hypothetical protein